MSRGTTRDPNYLWAAIWFLTFLLLAYSIALGLVEVAGVTADWLSNAMQWTLSEFS